MVVIIKFRENSNGLQCFLIFFLISLQESNGEYHSCKFDICSHTVGLRLLIQGGGRLLIFKNFIHPRPLLKPPPPFINFGKTMSKAQYGFYTKFCSKDKPLQCTRKLIRMFSFKNS